MLEVHSCSAEERRYVDIPEVQSRPLQLAEKLASFSRQPKSKEEEKGDFEHWHLNYPKPLRDLTRPFRFPPWSPPEPSPFR